MDIVKFVAFNGSICLEFYIFYEIPFDGSADSIKLHSPLASQLTNIILIYGDVLSVNSRGYSQN